MDNEIPNEEDLNRILGISDGEDNDDDVNDDLLDSPETVEVEDNEEQNLPDTRDIPEDRNETQVCKEDEEKSNGCSKEQIPTKENGVLSSNDEPVAFKERLPKEEKKSQTSNDENINEDELDFSLLDEKDDKDDSTPVSDNMDFSSLTFDELMKLMDDISDDYEEVADDNGEKKKPPINWKMVQKKLKEFEPHYREILRKVYQMYHQSIPAILPRFRSFVKDRNNKYDIKNLIGFESLDEYVDNNHPLWAEDREVCLNYLQGTNHSLTLADYIHSKWGNQQIDISKNNSFITRSTVASKPTRTRRKSLLNYTNVDVFDYQRKMLNKFCETDIEQVKREVLKKEEDRLACYNTREVKPNNNNNVNPRKRGFEQREEAFTEHEVKRLIKFRGEKDGWTVQRTAEAIIGVEEVFMMKGHYLKPNETVPSIPRSHLEEIIAMEEAHGMILDFYKDSTAEVSDEEGEDNWKDFAINNADDL